MENENKSPLRKITDKLFGGLNMSWPAVILFAIGTAVVTAVFLIVPIFLNTSFEMMGVQFEAWILFAVIIMANCKKPLESALKVFVFFLISQPLIYLLQVPFSWQGWGLFGYYRFWFILTLLTFPAAFLGWYINKKNWLSVLLFAPIFVYLAFTMYTGAREAVLRFPHLLIMALFCLGQILVYTFVFFPKLSQKAVGLVIVLLTVIVFAVGSSRLELSVYDNLPGEPSFSDSATITVEDESIAEVSFADPDTGRLYIEAHGYGDTTVLVKDGDREARYTLEVYDDNGVSRTRITED